MNAVETILNEMAEAIVDATAGDLAGDRAGDATAEVALDPSRSDRFVVAIAGPPAAGKTTLADSLKAALGQDASVLGLDAFHFDDAILEQRSQLTRKGSPATFDVDGYRRSLELLRTERSRDVSIPRFDRGLELSRNCAEIVSATSRFVITEGNYLLLREPGWSDLGSLFDLTVMAEASPETVRTRILDRWQGLGFSEQEAIERAERNDLPNARTVQENSVPADLVVITEVAS